MADARITQAAALALTAADPAPGARITQAAALALTDQAAEAARITQAAVLAATQHTLEAQITQASALVLADLVPCLTRWAQCWKITRRDGEVLGFTSLDRDLDFGGITYRACASLSASASELAALLGQVGNMELAGIIDDDAVSEDDLYGGLYDRAAVEVWMVPWQNAGGECPFRLAAGVTGNLSHGDRGFSMEVLTPGAMLGQQALLQTYTPGCRFELGDARCGVDLDALTVAGAVTSVPALDARRAAARRIFFDSSRTEDDGYFALGQVEWQTGRNAGARSEVKSYDKATGQFVLWAPMLHPIEVGDTYTAAPGCDKTSETCISKFDNFVNFGGFPHVPGRDSISQTPDAKG